MNFKIEKLETQTQPIAVSMGVALGAGALAVGSFGAGYAVGKDLAG